MSGGGPTAPVVFSGGDVAENTPGEITQLVRFAIESRADVATMERLVALQERVMARQAAIEYTESLALFQERCPILERKTKKTIATEGGGTYTIRYAELGQIAREIAPILKECGLAYTWNTHVDQQSKLVNVECILRHVNGHRESASFACPPTGTRAMSEPQKYASATTYAKRQSLCQVLGITTADPDTDGVDYEPISEAQADELRALADDVGAESAKFLAVVGAPTFEEIPADRFKMAKLLLQQKKGAKK